MASPPTRLPGLQIPADLPPALVPVAWLIGTWEGLGVGAHPSGEYQFHQRVTFTHDKRPFLGYDTTVWRLDTEGRPATPDARESGYWRVLPEGNLEVLITSADGVAEVYAGAVEGPRIEIATDVVMRTRTADAYTAGRRLYGLVEGDLMYAHDAAFEAADSGDRPGLASLRSARLRRAGD